MIDKHQTSLVYYDIMNLLPVDQAINIVVMFSYDGQALNIVVTFAYYDCQALNIVVIL